jgi:thiamine-phosphate pyrophosphorylase
MGAVMDQQNKQESPKARFVLLTPRVDDAARFAPLLAEACAAADIAAVILRLAPGSDAETLARIRVLAAGVHRVGASLLLDGRLHLVDAANADGVHVAGSAATTTARGAVKGDRVVGAGNLSNRHEAMLAGEGGADYVLFGEPDENGRRPSLDSLTERLAWWSELFVIPCVAYVTRIQDVAPLVRAGADFLAVGEEAVWNAPEGAVMALTACAAAMNVVGVPEPVA